MAGSRRPVPGRALFWILGGIAVLLVFALAVLITVVLLSRSGPIRGHPAPANATPTPTATPST